MMDPKKRFTSRVGNYVKFRPSYPPEVIEILRAGCGLEARWRVADFGSGTGLLSELFLRHGNPVFGVEPNQAMREAAEDYLKDYENFQSIVGSAEASGLDNACVDLVSAGQAFHWFQPGPTKIEFGRILKPGGWAALIWNERRKSGAAFLEDYERLLQEYAPGYEQVDHRRIDEGVIGEFFAPEGFATGTCENEQQLDLEALQGRLFSSSYTPEPGDTRYAPMIEAIREVYGRHQRGGAVKLEYDTRVYYGRMTVENARAEA